MTPFYTAFLGYFVLGEKIGRVEVFCAFSAFAGILLITKPTFVLSLLGREV
jgi:drug/metabolite transporter (DMT)-like permease